MKTIFLMFIISISTFGHTLKLKGYKPTSGKVLDIESLKNPKKQTFNFKVKSGKMQIKKQKVEYVVLDMDTLFFFKGIILRDSSRAKENITTIPKKEIKEGVYRNYAEFYYNKPSLSIDQISFDTTSKVGTSDLLQPNFFFVSNGKKIKYSKFKHGPVWGCYNNGQLYINDSHILARYIFTKATYEDNLLWYTTLASKGYSTSYVPTTVQFNFDTNKYIYLD